MEGPKTWGRVARKGAGTMRPIPGSTSRGEPKDFGRDRPAEHSPDTWARVDAEPREAAGRSRPTQAVEVDLDSDTMAGELQAALGATLAPKAERKMQDAARSFSRGYDEETRRILRPLAKQAPGASSVRELYGLSLYRLGRWREAIDELEAFRSLTGSTEQHPVLADCYRAQKRWARVDELWEDLRAASPSADLVAEGRIVVAGSLADRGRLTEAIATLEPSAKMVKRPRPHHLRMAYALADLRERSGDIPGARDLFEWIARHDPDMADAPQRAAALA
jgi:tetratricopeptide (TPR) repeat protein